MGVRFVTSDLLKRVVEKSLGSVGLEVRRKRSSSSCDEYPRSSLLGLLQHARTQGLSPTTVIDVGAAYGSFALEYHNIFPDATYLLIEPLSEYEPFLEAVTTSIPRCRYILAAATARSGEVVINAHPDLVGSSLHLENEDSDVNCVPRIVPAIALDSLEQGCETNAPFLVKIDVQGAELDVLSGAEDILRLTEYAILEVSFFEFFKGGPQFSDIVAFMKSRGFVAYDMSGLQYRPLDNALSQVDIAFVKEKGLFRKHHYYASARQREEQDARFESLRTEMAKKLR